MDQTDKQIDFGGHGELVVFCHANAYPPDCYRQFLNPLTRHYRVIAFRQRPLWDREGAKKLKSWQLFRDDLTEFMDRHQYKNAIAIGHSLGGIATWMASVQRPDLFARLILIDPVIVANSFVRGTWFLPFAIKAKYLPIVRTAMRRRNQWDDREAVRKHLGSKKLFQRFDPAVFEDFLKYGVRDCNDGVELTFPREWEARIYSCPPNMWPLMKKTPSPTTILKAQYSDVITSVSWSKIEEATANGNFYEMPGVGHLVPFEKPLALAEWVITTLNKRV